VHQTATLMSRRALVVFGMTVLLAVTLPAQRERIAAEFTRLAGEIPTLLPEAQRAPVLGRIERGRAALGAGRFYLALYDLQPAFEGAAGYRLAATASDYPDHTAFKTKWTALGPPAGPPTSRANVVFVEALAQGAEGRAPATYRASLPYAQDAGIQAGLYYLAESHAMVEFAALCRSLPLPSAGRRPDLASIEPQLAAYEKDVVAAYERAAAAERPQYAGVNVAIKLARTLDEQKRHEGALLQYLVSRFRYGLIRNPSPAGRADPKARLANVTLPAAVDHSIAEFFVQLARAASGDGSAPPSAASIILDDILPAYFEVVKR
jgi:hypothetical protein